MLLSSQRPPAPPLRYARPDHAANRQATLRRSAPGTSAPAAAVLAHSRASRTAPPGCGRHWKDALRDRRVCYRRRRLALPPDRSRPQDRILRRPTTTNLDPAPSPAASGAIAFALAKTSFASGQHASRLAIAERTLERRNASTAVGIAPKSVQAVVIGQCRKSPGRPAGSGSELKVDP